MGLDETFNVGIEGERIEVSSKGLGSPSMASLDVSSLNSS
jgi:uridine phosphorylase